MARKRSAKGQFVRGRSAKRIKRRRNPDAPPSTAGAALLAPKANPPAMEDLVEFVLPGFGGYAATKLLHRIIHTQLSKRYPQAGKHLAGASTVASAAAMWFLLHRVERLAKYHTPAVVGSAIASIQTLIQLYLPKYGWMVSDVQDSTPLLSATMSVPANAAAPVERLFPGGPEVVSETAADDLADLEHLSLGTLGGGMDDGDAEDYADMN